MRENVLFYICVPVYNVCEYIESCIKSVLNQTYSNYYLILIDDGSTDDSGKICDQFANNNNKISVVHQKNEGLISARRRAIKEVIERDKLYDSKCKKFIVNLDSDDTLRIDALNILKDKINDNDCDLIIYGLNNVVDDKVVGDSGKKFNGVIQNKRDLYKTVFLDQFYNSLCIKAISINLIKNIDYKQYYNINHGEDLIQSVQYYSESNKVLFINDKLYNYRLNPNSITHNITYENFDIDSTVRNYVLDFLKKENVWNQNDFNEYYFCCKKFFVSTIKNIAALKTKFNNKIELYKKMSEDCYYNRILNTKTKSMMIISLFKHKMFLTIIISCKIVGSVKKLCRIIFRTDNKKIKNN